MIFKSKTRRKVEAELMKLYKEMAEINSLKRKSNDTTAQVDLIIRKHQIEHDIELYRRLLTK
jgi:hypothetical protein